MTKQNNIDSISFAENQLVLNLNGEILKIDLKDLSEKLLKATAEERMKFIISPSGYGIHWPYLDEDISITAIRKYLLV